MVSMRNRTFGQRFPLNALHDRKVGLGMVLVPIEQAVQIASQNLVVLLFQHLHGFFGRLSNFGGTLISINRLLNSDRPGLGILNLWCCWHQLAFLERLDVLGSNALNDRR